MAARQAGQFRFDVDAALLFELGEQLVARKSIALAELVKNAYDADATKVVLTLNGVTVPGGSIVVEDNGSGMPYEVVRDEWMRIATTSKAKTATTPRFGRAITGAKGVGRFATRRLAHRLVLTTRVNRRDGALDETQVIFDWDDFRAGERLIDVPVEYRRRTLESGHTGTRLELQQAREIWSLSEVRDVRNDLQSLTPPFTSASSGASKVVQTAAFDVELVAPEFPEVEGSVLAKFLSAAVAVLEGLVGVDGVPTYTLRLRGRRTPFRLTATDLVLPELNGASLEVHFFRYEREWFVGTGMSVGSARELATSFAGVKIYLDGFRVFPYGDPGDDWLNLDADRGRRRTGVDAIVQAILPDTDNQRPLLQLPGNNNLFGAVFVSRDVHRGLRPTISRERFVANEAFMELTRFARVGIEWMVVQRAQVELRSSVGRLSRSRSSLPPDQVVSQGVSALRDHASSMSASRASIFNADLDEFQRSVAEAQSVQLEKVRVLRVLAAAGTMWLIFVHQLRGALDTLRRLVVDLQGGGAAAASALTRLKTWADVLEAQASELGLLLGRSNRQESRTLAISPVVEQVLATFAGYADERGIEFENAVPSGLRTPPIRPAELHAILINLITNALKAVLESTERRIRVEGRPRDGGVEFSVLDTGVGVRRRDRERVFEPFETTSSPDPVLGVGTGLGLALVRDIVSEHAGTVKFVDPIEPWKAEIVVRLPPGLGR